MAAAPIRARLAAGLLAALAGLPPGPALADVRADCLQEAPKGNVAACKLAILQRPGDPILRRAYALSLQRAGAYDRAIMEYKRVTELAPNEPRAFFEHAWILCFVRRYVEAKPSVEAAMRLKPDYVRAYKLANFVYFYTGEQGARFRATLKAAQLGDRVSMFDVAEYYEIGMGVAKDGAAARRWLRRAADKGHVAAMDRLVRVYLYGELGASADERQAEEWATRARRARGGDL